MTSQHLSVRAAQQQEAAAYNVEPITKAVNRNQRRTDDPVIEHDVLGMARRTRSLRKTCTNLCLTQAQVLFTMILQLADLFYRRRDGFGTPMQLDQTLPVTDSRRLQVLGKKAA